MFSSVEVTQQQQQQQERLLGSEQLPQISKVVRFAGDVDESEFKTGVKYTPKINKINRVQYKNVEARQLALSKNIETPQQGSLSKPNFEDILKRVSIVIHQHVQSCEERIRKLTPETCESGLFHRSQMEKFSEYHFVSPQYVYHFAHAPVCKLGFLFGIREVKKEYKSPDLAEVHRFISDLFVKAQLSAECSIVCLIYVERLMELGNVPICNTTWRPCLLCGLLLASKVWQDLSSWNSEFAQIYPQFSLQAINRLEGLFCQDIKWDLYISSSSYAKYYFALRSLTEKRSFRRCTSALLHLALSVLCRMS